MPRAVIVGATGQIGIAVARKLLGAGWDVTTVSRHVAAAADGCDHIVADARDAEKLGAVVGANTDLLLSCVAFDAVDAECLAEAGRAAGRIVAISSASVYCDAEGRTLDEAAECGFPSFALPLTEESKTVAPSGSTYSTRKIAMEKTLFSRAACAVTILRPCAVHGPASKHAREWWFVKRLLDGRSAIPLAYGGQSRFQTTSVDAIADAVLRACAGELPNIANVCDMDSPSVADIGRAIMDIVGARAEFIGLPAATPYPPEFGATPWSIPRPMICTGAAMSRAVYADAVEPAITWLMNHIQADRWQKLMPQLAAYPIDLFDYRADELAIRLPGATTLES